MKYLIHLNNLFSLKQKKIAFYLTILMLVAMMLEILSLNFLFLLISYMVDPSDIVKFKFYPLLKNFSEANEISVILSITIFFLGIFVLKTFSTVFLSFKQSKFFADTREDLSHNFLRGYLYMPRIFHLRSNTSNLIKNITFEIDSLIVSLRSFSIIVMEIIFLIGVSIFLLFINYKITIIAFALLTIFSGLYTVLNSKKILEIGKSRIKVIQDRLQKIIEGLTGSKVYELTGSQENLLDDFRILNKKNTKINYILEFRNSLPRPLFELFILLIIIFFFIIIHKDNELLKNSFPLIAVFLTAAYRLVPSFSRIMSSFQQFQFYVQTAERLARDKENFISGDISKQNELKNFSFSNLIEIKNLSFSYDKNYRSIKNLILKDINFKIYKGSKVGIYGESGSGKSTILDLIMGLSSAQLGEILVDDKKIENVKKNWQKSIGCVPQDVFIINDTLKKNIAFGVPENKIDENKLDNAIKNSQLSEFKKSLKFGYNTLLGDSGSRLSGGQKQRLGIARALYNDPQVLIFDESTSALDPLTEKIIIEEIFLNNKDKTIIFVSHNKNNLKFCDNVYEIADRSIITKNNEFK